MNELALWFQTEIVAYVTDPLNWTKPGAIAQMLGFAAVAFLFLQALDNSWAGGKLFERRGMWISSTVAAIIVFFVFVLPFMSWQLIVGLLGVAVFIGFAMWAKTHIH